MAKRIIAVLLSALLGLGILAGCDKGTDGQEKAVEMTVFTAPATARVFRNIPVENPADTGISLVAARNEYEGAQIVMYSEKRVNGYDVKVSDLVCGDWIIPAENASLYNVKYIDSTGISSRYNNESLPAGSQVPDALLPFATAVEYGENVVEAGCNQAVYVEYYIPKTAQPGIYEGTASILAAGYEYCVPVTISVRDFTVPDVSSTQSYFARWGREHYTSAELGISDEKDEVYYNALLKYRMGSTLPFEGEGGTERYVQLLRKYYTAPGFSGYKFFYEATYSVYNGAFTGFNAPLLKQYLKAVARAAVEDGVDYLDKAMLYFSTFVDEPGSNPNTTWEDVATVAHTVTAVLEDTAAELDEELGDEVFWRENVRDSLVGMPNLIPGDYTVDDLRAVQAEAITTCPGPDLYNTEAQRASYDRESDGMQEWWYVCIGPQYPYPNVLMNNWPVGTRLISWMQKAYDVDGFLVWDAMNYTTLDNNGYPVVNTYDKLTDTMTGVSDGKLFYPGTPYGLETPVASLRCIAYRDGMEDYEVLQGLYDVYAANGLDASVALQGYYDELFSGTITTTDETAFYGVREQVFDLLESSQGECALLYEEVSVTEDDAEIRFRLANPDATAEAEAGELTQENGVYTLRLKSSQTDSLAVTVKAGAAEQRYERFVFGEYSRFYDAESGENPVSVSDGSTAELSSQHAHGGENSVRVSLAGSAEGQAAPWFAVPAEAFGKSVQEISSLTVWIYAPAAATLSVSARYVVEEVNGRVIYGSEIMGELALQEGMNYVEYAVPASVKALNDVTEFRFSHDGALELYLDDFGTRGVSDAGYAPTVCGEISANRADTSSVTVGEKQWLIVENDVSNVVEDGCLLLADFENYNQVAQIAFVNNFGLLEMVDDAPYVTHGGHALKMTIIGREESQRHYNPMMIIHTTRDYFQKTDFSDVDYIEADIYNGMDYDVTVRFLKTKVYYSKDTASVSLTLKPGANTVRIYLDDLKNAADSSNEFNQLVFLFDRGELHEERQVLYFDNIRAHFKSQ